MELRQIRDFLVVAKAGSFASASKVLNVSQAGLGYQIKQLEISLRAALLVRHSRGVSLTPAGAVFLRHAEALVGEVDVARSEVAEAAKAPNREHVRVGVSPTTAQLLGPALAAADSPAARFTLLQDTSHDLIAALGRGEVDVVICLWQADFVAAGSPLYRERLCLFGIPDAAEGGDTLPFRDLSGVALIGAPRGHVLRNTLDDAAERAGVTLKFVQDIKPGSLSRSLLLHSGQRMIGPHSLLQDDVEAGLLGRRLLVDPSLWCEIRMACHPDVPAKIRRIILEVVRESVRGREIAIEWIG